MTATAVEIGSAKPYKGPDSYQTEDAHLFFGRDGEAEELVSTILSNRLTLLHAQSGSGKTSLLNARVMPRLESKFWLPIRATPHDDPIEAVKLATLQQLLPPPISECQAIEHACATLVGGSPGVRLHDLLAAYARVGKSDPLRRELIARITVPCENGASDATVTGTVTPFFVRLLRGSISMERFAEHVAALAGCRSEGVPRSSHLDESIPVGELLATIQSDTVRECYGDTVNEIKTYPLFGLRPFFENLIEVWGARHSRYAIVLVLDQFEELFTRFGDQTTKQPAESTAMLDWRFRREFFNELANLYGNEGASQIDESGDTDLPVPPLPIRYVISIRNEYVALLDDIRQMVRTLEDSTFHLTLLPREQAEQAIRQPALEYGYDYEPACFRELVSKLTKEDRFVEPGQLQIVCEKLWHARGKHLVQGNAAAGPGSSLPMIQYAEFKKLGGIDGIVSSFVQDFLSSLKEADRFEVLDMLEPLITGSGTRNLAEWNQLIRRPFRNPNQRERLLELMVKRTIVRVERRPTGRLVEITHEFLIPPIQRALAEALTSGGNNSRLRTALGTLRSFGYRDFRADVSFLLSPAEVANLHANRDRISWTGWATELMLRSAISHGADSQVIQEWSHRVDALNGSGPPVLEQLLARRGPARTYSLEELGVINTHRQELNGLKLEEVDWILRSELSQGTEADADDIAYWTRRGAAHADEHATNN